MKSSSLVLSRAPLTKRTRINVKQSKYGCFTCRTRRVKCDETKPSCLRCKKSGKQCEGYRDRTSQQPDCLDPQLDTSSRDKQWSLLYAGHSRSWIYHTLSSGLRCSPQEARYSRLGLSVLLQEHPENTSWNDQPLWIRLLAQLLTVDDAVSNAVVFLGTVCEARFLSKTHHQPLLVLARNQKALAVLQKEIASLPKGPIPVFLASVVLAAAEVVQRHLINALVHLRGAYRILTYIWPQPLHLEQSAETDLHPACTRGAVVDTIAGALCTLAQSLDLQTAWYALSNPPELQQMYDITKPFPAADDLANTGTVVLSLLHSCYHFTHRAAKFKYCASAHTPPSLILEQSRYIAALTACLAKVAPTSSQNMGSAIESISRIPSVLRVQCLSTFIYLSTILSPYETTYDSYAAQFQEILKISEEIVAPLQPAKSTSSPPCFQLQPGVFQALYLTAMKYRDPYHRRRAVAMLTRVGIEGPWNARLMSYVAERAIEIEETGQHCQKLECHGSTAIPEMQRLHGCGLDSSAPESAFPAHIQLHFSLCKNVQYMLQANNYEDPEHWIIWDEQIEAQG